MQNIIENIMKHSIEYTSYGNVADYIPELAKANRNEFGICICNGEEMYLCGDAQKRFTAQSVIKPIILLLALADSGVEAVEKLVGTESTGKPFDAFNYSDQALKNAHINPMINTGAIALCTLIKGDTFEEKFQRLLRLTQELANNSDIDIDMHVYLSEKETGNKNRALAYMLKAYKMIDADAEEVLDCYFRACSVNVTCKDLSIIGNTLANRGYCSLRKKQIVKNEYAKYVNAVLMTCGMYDGSGEFAVKVGVPAKSGVGGGIMAVVPGKMGIGLYSPALDKKGNSFAGVKALEMLSNKLDLSIF